MSETAIQPLADRSAADAEPLTDIASGDATSAREESSVSIADHDVPVTLRFEAGALTVPMDQLAHIPPGHVFELNKPLDRQAIEIFANDRAVATGELVLIGDAIGVRLTSIRPRETTVRA